MRNDTRRRGFSLTEILLALCLLGFALDLLYLEHIGLARDLRTQQDRARAVLLAQEWLELSAADLPGIGPQTWRTTLPPRYGMECVMEAHPFPRFPYLREVVITVRWRGPEGGPQHELRLGRLVSERLVPGQG